MDILKKKFEEEIKKQNELFQIEFDLMNTCQMNLPIDYFIEIKLAKNNEEYPTQKINLDLSELFPGKSTKKIQMIDS